MADLEDEPTAMKNDENDNQEGTVQNDQADEQNQDASFLSNKITLKQIAVGAFIGFICYYIYIFFSKPLDLEKEFYNTMGASIMRKQSFLEYKYSHDLIEKAINSIELKSKNSFVSHQQNTLAKTDLKKYKPDLKLSLRTQLKYDKLPTDLNSKIDLAISKAEYLQSGKDTYIQVDLSDAYGGSHYVGFGILGFIEDPNNNNTVMMGVSVYREEWNEQDNVRIKLANWDKLDVERYIQFELYRRIYDKMGEKFRIGINSKNDFTKVIKNLKKTNKNKVNCQITQTHIIFINDKSGSMSGTDNGLSKPEYGFIKDAGHLENRLGCLYSAMQDFLQVRYDNNCNDFVSTVLFDSDAQVVSNKIRLSDTFVNDYLIKHRPGGGTNFGKGFQQADTLIKYDENTLVIFLTDGEASNGGASNVVSKWKKNMGDKLKLYCVALGREKDKAVVKRICNEGNGEMKQVLHGAELIETYNDIVWKEFKRI